MQQQAIHCSDPNVTQINNYTLELCKIVTSYYLVESLTDDNSSSLLSSLKKSANDTVEFWVSVMYIFPLIQGQASHSSIDILISLSAIRYV